MLKITIPAIEQYDEVNNLFITSKEQILQLEHSLVSLSKWESRWRKPFLSKEPKTIEETIDYIKCMTITQNVNDEAYNFITDDIIIQIQDYIQAPMTATTFSMEKRAVNNEVATSEIIYYWMISMNIPFECQKWHLNKLIALINICNIKNQPPKKRPKQEITNRNAALNAARREMLNSKG